MLEQIGLLIGGAVLGAGAYKILPRPAKSQELQASPQVMASVIGSAKMVGEALELHEMLVADDSGNYVPYDPPQFARPGEHPTRASWRLLEETGKHHSARRVGD